MSRVEFEYRGLLVGVNQKTARYKKGAVNSKHYKLCIQNLCEEMILYKPSKPFTDPIQVNIVLYGYKYDVDNVAKPILDAMQQVGIIDDDKNVKQLLITKHKNGIKKVKIQVRNFV